MNRRGFLFGLTCAVAAPAIIRTAGLLMPIRPIRWAPSPVRLRWVAADFGGTGEHVICADYNPRDGSWVFDRYVEEFEPIPIVFPDAPDVPFLTRNLPTRVPPALRPVVRLGVPRVVDYATNWTAAVLGGSV